MSTFHADDWAGEITAAILNQVQTLREAGEPDPVVVLISPAFAGGQALLAAQGQYGLKEGDLTPLLVVPGRRLSELLDSVVAPGVGRTVMEVGLKGAGLIRGVLVLPETIEVFALAPQPGRNPASPSCILDLAARRLHVSDDEGKSWDSRNLVL